MRLALRAIALMHCIDVTFVAARQKIRYWESGIGQTNMS
jgi:hypothetical protein